MATISIEGGTVQLSSNLYRYEYGTMEGRVVVLFTASQKPKVGDKIVEGTHVPLTEWKINGDVSRWLPEPSDEWPDDPSM